MPFKPTAARSPLNKSLGAIGRPDIAGILRYWKLSLVDIERVQQQYSAKHIHEKIELLKFSKKVLRLKDGSRRTTAADERLRQWVRGVYETHPEEWRKIERLLDELKNEPANRWLLRAIEQNVQVPPIVGHQPVLPSDRVSSACVKRLRLLYDAGWLDKDEPLTKPRHGRGQTLWYITKKSRAYLAQVRGVSVKEVRWKNRRNIRPFAHCPSTGN